MSIELGLAITFRFRTWPGVPLEHGPGSRGFKDLPWVALTIPKYHLATRLSLCWYHKHAGSGSGPWSIPIWHRRRWESGAAPLTVLFCLDSSPSSRLSAEASHGARDIGFFCRGRQGDKARDKPWLAISWPTCCYRRRPAPKSTGQYPPVIGRAKARASWGLLEAAVADQKKNQQTFYGTAHGMCCPRLA